MSNPAFSAPPSATNIASVAYYTFSINSVFSAVRQDGTVVAWGNSSITNQLNTLTNAVTTYANAFTAAVLRPDGKLVSSSGTIINTNAVAIVSAGGNGNYSVLGMNGRVTTSGISGSFITNTYAIFGDPNNFSIDRIYSDGTVAGNNLDGRLAVDLTNAVDSSGPGTTALSSQAFRVWLKADGTVESLPIPAPGGLSNVVMIASGTSHSLALKGDGTVVGWGTNTTALQVPPGLSNVIAISTSSTLSLALLSNRTVVAWGTSATNVPNDLTNVADLFPLGAIVGDTPPSVVSQSPDVNAWSGEPASFCIKAVGSRPLYYQWQANGTNIPNATNFFYRIPNASMSDPGSFQAIVSNEFGTAISRPVSLTVRDGVPLIAKMEGFTKITSPGKPNTFIQNFGGKLDGSEPMSYEWFHNGVAFQAPASFLQITNSTLAQSGNYWFVASNAFGIQTSKVFSVVNVAAEISQEPSDVSAPWGTRTNLSVGVIGEAAFTYQWYFNDQL